MVYKKRTANFNPERRTSDSWSDLVFLRVLQADECESLDMAIGGTHLNSDPARKIGYDKETSCVSKWWNHKGPRWRRKQKDDFLFSA